MNSKSRPGKIGRLEISQDARFTPADFAEVLPCLPKVCPLVGGQAVAWWAGRYGIKPTHEGRERPVTSQNIDFWGGREDLKRLAARMKRSADRAHPRRGGERGTVLSGSRQAEDFLRGALAEGHFV